MSGTASLVSASPPPSPAIRVAYCIDSFEVGGTELNALRTLEALDRRRFQVSVFHFHETGPLRARYDSLGVELLHLPIGPLYAPRTAAQGMRFLRLLRRHRIQLVHAHDVYTNVFAAPWARLSGCRMIASRRWLDDVPHPGLAVLNRWSYRLAHRVLANSALTARVLVEDEGVPAGRVIELPNFLEERAFRRVSAEVRSARLRSWGVPPGAFVIGSVARLSPIKNHAMLLRALANLGEENHLVLIGDGPERAALEELAVTLHVDSRVHFAGKLLEPANLHQFFDVSVLCSRSESFPNSVIEALAAGCPVVATPVGGLPEVIIHRRTGVLVPVDAVGTLTACLEELRMDAGLRARLSEAGLASVRIKYHESVVIAQLESLYHEVSSGAVRKDALLT